MVQHDLAAMPAGLGALGDEDVHPGVDLTDGVLLGPDESGDGDAVPRPSSRSSARRRSLALAIRRMGCSKAASEVSSAPVRIERLRAAVLDGLLEEGAASPLEAGRGRTAGADRRCADFRLFAGHAMLAGGSHVLQDPARHRCCRTACRPEWSLDPLEFRAHGPRRMPGGPSTPKPPARLTAATTSRQCAEGDSSGNSIPSMS